MKLFINSGILRRMLILAVLMGGAYFVMTAEKVSANDDPCCNFCNHVYAYCGQFVYANDIYETLWDCIVDHGGEDCGICDPTC